MVVNIRGKEYYVLMCSSVVVKRKMESEMRKLGDEIVSDDKLIQALKEQGKLA